MASPLSLPLDKNTRRRLERIAQRRNVPVSHIIREAISRWIEAEQDARSPYDTLADLIGVVKGGDPGRSENTGRSVARLLKTRRQR